MFYFYDVIVLRVIEHFEFVFVFQDRVVLLHHPVAKVKRQKLLNTEIKKVRRKLSMDKASQKSQKGKFLIDFIVLQLHLSFLPIKITL